MRARVGIIATLVMLSCSAARPAAAQPCVGDCNGDGAVAINELVLAVAIAVGAAPLAQCPSIGPAPVGIDRVIASVNGALCACAPCPTPPPTRTPTATPAVTATAVPSATPEPPTFESAWREDSARLGRSTCTRQINDGVRRAIGAVSCRLDVARRQDRVAITDCDGFTLAGGIDDAGLVRVATTLSERSGSCTVTLVIDLAVSLARSPATATYAIAVQFTGDCGGVADCGLAATTRWTRLSGTIAGTSGAASTGMLGALRHR
jgi:hypothetical protein